ncbi:PREDICTED: uncharacterized protein LOC104819589 [Tarenaya hassleriana]|uniref:uncharacterized protein LOC104819589 n=1 Tax=Tarenaya hassleriana TaxID=28532 RepID=UPI00053C1478|nr:PREDICTED: uncharacterized protein LOC104819589 [Tarenaya hassleriana]
MVIKRIEFCIELLKIAMEFVVVVAEAIGIVLQQHISNLPPPSPPPPFLRRGPYSYSAAAAAPSFPSPFVIGFLP